jgi:Ca2+/Na+ antiporter
MQMFFCFLYLKRSSKKSLVRGKSKNLGKNPKKSRHKKNEKNMFDSVVLNMVISLVFIYSLYSLLVTTINEIAASFFSLRAKTLEKAIARMLTDNNEKLNETVTKFYQQPLIKYLAEDNTSKPSYLTSASFANTLVHLCNDFAAGAPETQAQLLNGIQKIKEVNPETGNYLETLYNEAGGDVSKFKALSENWFNETMDRASGWYKKQTQKITLVVAFLVAVVFNVDTIGIVKNLSINPKLAIEMVEMADKYAKVSQNNSVEPNKEVNDQIQASIQAAQKLVASNSDIHNTNAVLGLGWSIPKDTIPNLEAAKTAGTTAKYMVVEKGLICKILYVLTVALPKSFVGLLITALAISLGAPFWFDLLNKLMQLRGSKKVESAEPKAT